MFSGLTIFNRVKNKGESNREGNTPYFLTLSVPQLVQAGREGLRK